MWVCEGEGVGDGLGRRMHAYGVVVSIGLLVGVVARLVRSNSACDWRVRLADATGGCYWHAPAPELAHILSPLLR